MRLLSLSQHQIFDIDRTIDFNIYLREHSSKDFFTWDLWCLNSSDKNKLTTGATFCYLVRVWAYTTHKMKTSVLRDYSIEVKNNGVL